MRCVRRWCRYLLRYRYLPTYAALGEPCSGVVPRFLAVPAFAYLHETITVSIDSSCLCKITCGRALECTFSVSLLAVRSRCPNPHPWWYSRMTLPGCCRLTGSRRAGPGKLGLFSGRSLANLSSRRDSFLAPLVRLRPGGAFLPTDLVSPGVPVDKVDSLVAARARPPASRR